MAAIDNILHRLVVQLNFGGLEDDGEFGGAVWGYDLHTATGTSFQGVSCRLTHSRSPQMCKLRSLQMCYSFCIPQRTTSSGHGSIIVNPSMQRYLKPNIKPIWTWACTCYKQLRMHVGQVSPGQALYRLQPCQRTVAGNTPGNSWCMAGRHIPRLSPLNIFISAVIGPLGSRGQVYCPLPVAGPQLASKANTGFAYRHCCTAIRETTLHAESTTACRTLPKSLLHHTTTTFWHIHTSHAACSHVPTTHEPCTTHHQEVPVS